MLNPIAIAYLFAHLNRCFSDNFIIQLLFQFIMRICAIGDPHGSLDKVKEAPLSDVDLILLTGDLGSANLMRKMAFDNIERKKQIRKILS